MRPQMKAIFWIGATFVAGTGFGMVLNGALAARAAQNADMAHQPGGAGPTPGNGEQPTGPAGFVGTMDRVIQPRDEVQRKQLRPYFESTDRSNRAIVDGARLSMSAALDSLRVAINPLLDEAQRQRLAQFSGPPRGESAPGMGGRGMSPDGPPRGGPPR
ncbi:MAG: hypothetical protein ABJB74_11990 [Gemmatimonas sp.]